MKKLKLKRKVFKGMTLMEVIIAIAIVAVMSTVIVTSGMAINSYLRSARDVNDRVAMQAPVAQAGYNIGATKLSDGVDIKLSPQGVTGDIYLHGQAYAVFDEAQMEEHSDEFGRRLNMKFIADIETTQPTT